MKYHEFRDAYRNAETDEARQELIARYRQETDQATANEDVARVLKFDQKKRISPHHPCAVCD